MLYMLCLFVFNIGFLRCIRKYLFFSRVEVFTEWSREAWGFLWPFQAVSEVPLFSTTSLWGWIFFIYFNQNNLCNWLNAESNRRIQLSSIKWDIKEIWKNVKQYHISYSSLFNKGCYLCYFRKDRGTKDQIANICWIIEKAREFQKNIYFCLIDYAKAFNCVDHHKLWKILKEMEISDHLTCLLRSLYAGQEATVRTGHGATDWFHIGKGVCQGCILSPCLFNLYAEYIMWNTRLDEAQAGIKIAGRNINNLRYADDTTFMAKVKNN